MANKKPPVRVETKPLIDDFERRMKRAVELLETQALIFKNTAADYQRTVCFLQECEISLQIAHNQIKQEKIACLSDITASENKSMIYAAIISICVAMVTLAVVYGS